MQNAFKSNCKRNIVIFFNLFYLSLKSFFTSMINIFLGIILIIFVIFVWLMLHADEPFLLASAVGAVIVRNGTHLFYRTLDMHRVGNINTRISYTPLSLWVRPSAQIFANFCINLLLSLILIFLTLLFYPSQRNIAANVDWLFFIPSSISLWILVAFMTLAVINFVKSSLTGLIISIIFFIISWNFLGITFPYHVIASYKGLNIALYLFPPRYMLNAMQSAWVGSRNLVFEDLNFANGTSSIDYSVDFKLGGTMLVPFGVSYGIILVLATILVIKSIKERNLVKKDSFGSSLIQKLSSEYIRNIKRCTSFEQLNTLRQSHFEERGIKLKQGEVVKTNLKIKKPIKVKKVRKSEDN